MRESEVRTAEWIEHHPRIAFLGNIGAGPPRRRFTILATEIGEGLIESFGVPPPFRERSGMRKDIAPTGARHACRESRNCIHSHVRRFKMQA